VTEQAPEDSSQDDGVKPSEEPPELKVISPVGGFVEDPETEAVHVVSSPVRRRWKEQSTMVSVAVCEGAVTVNGVVPELASL
jgi:hypothetical protein